MSNFSAATATTIAACEQARTFTSHRTSDAKRNSIAMHVDMQTKPYRAAFGKEILEIEQWRARRAARKA